DSSLFQGMSGEGPPNNDLPGNAPEYRVFHPRFLGDHVLHTQQAAAAEGGAVPQPQAIQPQRAGEPYNVHPMNAAVEQAAAGAEQARREAQMRQYLQHLANRQAQQQHHQQQQQQHQQMQRNIMAQQQDELRAQQAAVIAAAMNRQMQMQPQMQQIQNQQPEVHQMWAGGEGPQPMNVAPPRPANPQNMRFYQVRAGAPVHGVVRIGGGPQVAHVDAHAAQAAQAAHAAAARAAHAVAHAHHVQMVAAPAHDHGIYMMRAQQPVGPPEAPEVRAARLKAERDANEETDNLARRYSRACFICTNPNPLRRAVLVACGHIICSPCAEEAKGSSCHLKCPFCRKPSTFVKIFEDEAKEEESDKQHQPPPKRRHDDGVNDESESTSTNEPAP
ncbi:hypothetical protein PMAYCL1PPCAC_25145, partial [Pristionchus mayeri]